MRFIFASMEIIESEYGGIVGGWIKFQWLNLLINYWGRKKWEA